jgi:hypothetical protein
MADGFYQEHIVLAAATSGPCAAARTRPGRSGDERTTSVAVVYAVMVETGLNRHDLGKLILAACFITDLGTVLALGGLFASYGWLLTVVILSAFVPTLIAQQLFRPAIVDSDEEEALGEEDISIVRHHRGLSSSHDQPLGERG